MIIRDRKDLAEDKIQEISDNYQRILGEVKTTNKLSQKLINHENKALSYFTVLMGFFAFLGIFVSVVSLYRVDKAAERAEKYVEEITGRTKPDSAETYGRTNSDTSPLLAISTIRPIDDDFLNRYRLTLQIPVYIQIKGSPGNLLGVQQYLGGPWLDILLDEEVRIAGGTSEEEIQFEREILALPNFETLTESEYRLVESTPFSVRLSFTRAFLSCEDASRVLDSLLENQDGRNIVSVRPVFEYIEEEPDFQDVSVKTFRSLSSSSCENSLPANE